MLLGLEEREPGASIDWDADPDWEFRTAPDENPGYLYDLYTQACERSRAAVAQVGDPDALAVRPRRRTGEPINLRWIMLHMIEETARHNGHADLLRESIDGTTGD